MMTSLEDALFDAFTPLFPVDTPILYADENNLEPVASYVTLKPTVFDSQGTAQRGYLVREGKTVVAQDYVYVVRVTTVGAQASELAMQGVSLLDHPMLIEEFQKRGFGYMGKSSVRRMPVLREDAWVPSYQFDVQFSVHITSSFDTPDITVVNSVATVSNGGATQAQLDGSWTLDGSVALQGFRNE